MPELPEVEIIKKELQKHCANKTIINVKLYNKKLKYKLSKKIYLIKKKKIIKIIRISKYLIIKFNYYNLLIHLGIDGNILIKKKKKINKNIQMNIKLNNNYYIHYKSIRKFGFIKFYKNFKDILIKKKLGIDPLNKKFNTKYIFKIINKHKSIIYKLLVNQKKISGIGNIYAQEILFRSNILPYKKSKKIKKKKIKILIKNIKKTLKKSIKYKSTLYRDKNNINHNPAFFKKFLYIYRNINTCKICNNKTKFIKINKKNLYFCKNCQN